MNQSNIGNLQQDYDADAAYALAIEAVELNPELITNILTPEEGAEALREMLWIAGKWMNADYTSNDALLDMRKLIAGGAKRYAEHTGVL